MLKTKRKFRRFDLPLAIKFKPTYGAKEYFPGSATNLSCEGLGVDADDFRFIMYENLELLLGLPGGNDSVSLYGDILWKKQDGRKCSAGLKFRMKDKAAQEAAVKKIFSVLKIPAEDIYRIDTDYAVKKTEKKLPGDIKALNKLGLMKQYCEKGKKCRVTFRLLRDTAKNSGRVMIVGDFNDWDTFRSPMTRLENGDFVITLDLDSRRTYRFKYLIDGSRWENDLYADRFEKNDFGSKDSVVIV